MSNGICVHFNGLSHEACRHGIFFDERWPSGAVPCIQRIGRSNRGGAFLAPGERPIESRPFPGADQASPCEFYTESGGDQ